MNWKTEQGFKELFSAYYNPLCNYAFSVLKDDFYAEDAVHDVLMNLWSKRTSININKEALKSYLFTSTKNKALQIIKSGKTKLQYEEVYSQLNVLNREESSQLEDNYIFKEALKRSVRQLPDKCREIYLMRTQNGLTYAEIAAQKSLSQRTVENQMAIAIKKLRESIKKQLNLYK